VISEYLENNYEEVSYEVFYRDLFPVGSFEKKGVFEDGKYNGIAISIGQEDEKVKRYTITDDLEKIDELVLSDDFCLMSPISYIGKSRKSQNARYLYALAIDLDGVTTDERMRFFLNQCEFGYDMRAFVWGLPKPTYLVSSGTGIHIYYFFKKPIALFPSAVKPLEKLKRRLTWQAWTQGASSLHDNVQYESLFQGFRVVGSITKTGSRVRAFKVGGKVDIDYLNYHVPEEYAVQSLSYKSDLPLKKAKELYPEWYEKRIINKQPKGSWQCKRALYDWWIRKTLSGWAEGHRYWCIMTLAAYAVKCGIEYEELEADAFKLLPVMNKGAKSPFTKEDVVKALEAYNDSYITYPIHVIEARTGIQLPRNKRNGLKQKDHLEIARAIQTIKDRQQGKNWREGNGRPKGSSQQKKLVEEWQKSHPDGRKVDCIRDTGLSKPTVYRWWNG